MKEITLEFDKIVGEGKTLGRHGGKVVFAYGVLPGEKAVLSVTKEKRNFIEGEIVNVISSSPKRITPKEDHYLSCSPWQIMDYNYQLENKKKLAEDLYYQTVKDNIKIEKIFRAASIFSYRTKIEYSFTETPQGLSFAFHKRGAYWEKLKLPSGCALINERVNSVALRILEKLNKMKIKQEQLKTLILRQSKNSSDILASLFVKDENINLSTGDIEGLKGFTLAFSNPISSVSTADKILKKEGDDFLTEKIGDMEFDYGFDCFFQNNIELFAIVLEEMKNYGSDFGKTLDLYCGIGVIGFYLKDKISSLISIETSSSSTKFALKNMEKNSIKNAQVICSSDREAQKEIFNGIETVILDPPRAGLHKNVIKNIMENLPQRIVYLSCNPITQGRDASFFLEKYKIKKAQCFDFYPNTPHLETLLIFERK